MNIIYHSFIIVYGVDMVDFNHKESQTLSRRLLSFFNNYLQIKEALCLGWL